MPTQIYRLKDKARVPSVTTINKIGQDSGGLLHWAWTQGIEGRDYRQVRDDAAEAGNVGHALVEAAIKNAIPDLSKYKDEARVAGEMAFSAYSEWRSQSKITMVSSEVPLVSERFKYGGTLDAVVKNSSGALCLADWKTGGLYPDHLCQVAAYGQLWNENYPDKPITGGYHLLRFNRDSGDFSHAFFADLSEAWDAFLLKRQLYDLLSKIKKRV